MIDIKVPTVGESIREVTLLKWVKQDGEYVERDDVIAELESEKATFEVNAEKAGKLKWGAQEGDTLNIGDLLATIDPQGRFRDLNPACTEITGYQREELLDVALVDLIHPDDRPGLVEAMSRVAQGTPISHYETRFRCKNGWEATYQRALSLDPSLTDARDELMRAEAMLRAAGGK